MARNKELFETSNYPKNHFIYSETNRYEVEKMIDKKGVLLTLALGKPTEQSSTFHTYGAQLAADGYRGTDLLQEQCTHTGDGDTNPWWRVDLLTVYTFTSVRILNRGMDAGEDRLRDVTITVGLTKFDVNTPFGFFAGPGTASQLVVIDCTTLPRARFVKIFKTTEALTLCEVNVFGFSV